MAIIPCAIQYILVGYLFYKHLSSNNYEVKQKLKRKKEKPGGECTNIFTGATSAW